MGFYLGAISAVQGLAVGTAAGFADFLFTTTSQKVCMLAGVKFEEEVDEGDIPPSERFDRCFADLVVKYPIAEEAIFRGVLQPVLAEGLIICIPKLAAPALLGIPIANVVSAVAIGVGFGSLHYFNYKQGGKHVAVIGSISGSFYGMVKECFGLPGSIAAHITHNFMTAWLDKHYPEILESESERKQRLLKMEGKRSYFSLPSRAST